jgi:hypothetical protein
MRFKIEKLVHFVCYRRLPKPTEAYKSLPTPTETYRRLSSPTDAHRPYRRLSSPTDAHRRLPTNTIDSGPVYTNQVLESGGTHNDRPEPCLFSVDTLPLRSAMLKS